MKKRNLVALMLGLTISTSAASALAAEANQPDGTVDPAAFTDVPKDHWAYGALEILAKDGVLEGYSDGSFQGDKPMTRYEMAQIIVNAYNNRGGFADEALADGIRQELAPELKNMKKMQKQINKNASAIAQMRQLTDKLSIGGFAQVRWENNNARNYNSQTDQDRFYLSLKSDYKVNDKWKVKTELELNHKYGNYHREYGGNNEGVDAKNFLYYGHGRNDSAMKLRLWMEGQLSDKLSVELGRKWKGLGFQNVAFGEDADEITFDYKFRKDSDLTVSAFYWKPVQKEVNQIGIAGLGLKGTMGHGTQMQLNIARANVEKTGSTVGYLEYDTGSAGNPVIWEHGNQLINLSMLQNFAPNLFLWADYSRTNADTENTATAAKVTYKWTNLNDPGSFQLYAGWHNFKDHGRWLGDTADNLFPDGSTGWSFGGKYVFAPNVEGELTYAINTAKEAVGNADYKNRIIRGQVNFHF